MKKIVHILFLILVIFVDRVSKCWALKTLSYTPVSVFYGFNLVLAWNRGVSWSMLQTDSRLGFWLLTIGIMLILAGFAVYTVRRAQRHLSIWYELLVLGGAISNVIDRFWYGAVPDFIEWYIGQWSWPVFNIADLVIVLGVCGIFIRTWRENDARDV